MHAAFTPLRGAVVREGRAWLGDGLAAVAVFGSVARGTAGPGSDVDVLVVGDWPVGAFKRFEAFVPVLDAVAGEPREPERAGFRAEVSPVLRTEAELGSFAFLHLDLATDGVILHDPRSVLAERLAGVRAMLARLGTRKVSYAGGWYCLLKPDLRPGEDIEL